MNKITLKGLAGAASCGDDELKNEYLYILDGIECQEEFSEYFDDDESLMNKGVTNGYMRFEFNENDKRLYVIVEYDSQEELTENELDILIDYTQGELSDGIGEVFEQTPCADDDNDNEIYVSPWYYGQELTATQENIN
jgi:hypothetical protein